MSRGSSSPACREREREGKRCLYFKVEERTYFLTIHWIPRRRLDRSHASACRETRLVTVDRCADFPVSLPVAINELVVRCV